MARNIDNKCLQCRRAGEKLFLKGERCLSPKCAMVKRNTPPGVHGPKGRKRLSGYGLQLQAKQEAKRYYGLQEKQFRLTFAKAAKQSGDAGKNLLKLLESRLDNAVFRLGFAISRPQARQLVNHGHFLLNGRKADIASMLVKPGQEIKIKKNSLGNRYFKNLSEQLKKAERPSWLSFDDSSLIAKVLHEPKDEDLPKNIKVQMVVEYYSK